VKNILAIIANFHALPEKVRTQNPIYFFVCLFGGDKTPTFMLL